MKIIEQEDRDIYPNFCTKLSQQHKQKYLKILCDWIGYDPLIFDRTKGLVLGPSTALYRSFLTHCTLTNKAAGPI